MAPTAEPEDFVNGYDCSPSKTTAEVFIDCHPMSSNIYFSFYNERNASVERQTLLNRNAMVC